MNPSEYEAWYATARGSWIAGREFSLIMRLLEPPAGATLLDVGCGTGHFSRCFAAAGLQVTGLDSDPAMLNYARSRGSATVFPSVLPWSAFLAVLLRKPDRAEAPGAALRRGNYAVSHRDRRGRA